MADVPHQHPGDERSSYYLDQLFMIGVCGAVAAVTIMLWRSGSLNTLLHEKFALAVGAGGLGLLALVILRAISVWTSVDTHADTAAGHVHGHECDHGHGHDHSHSHGHGHEGHSHGHEPPAPAAPAPGPASGGAMSLALAPSVAGPAPAAPAPAILHSHGHSPSPGHSHAHGDHSHGGSPWRYIVLLLPVVLYFLVLSNSSFNREPIDKPTDPLEHIQNFILVFRSILWEALPFIILGAVIAGLLEEFLPQRVMTAIVPKNPFVAICLGGLLGLVFPMCECGIIPIMRRLLRKGLPLSCCVAYLLAGPIINVVVILSTMAAFSGMENTYVNGKPAYQMGSLWMTLFRVGLGYVVAVVTGLIVEAQHRKHGDALLTPLTRPNPKLAAEDDAPAGPARPLWERIGHVTETALGDFVDITVFLILGALLSATVRIFIGPEQIATLSGDPAGSLLSVNAVVAIVLMMGLAIALCLCSEADAFVAASFSTLRPSAKVAFLVLGPMLDFKLYAMYTRIFRPRLTFTIYGAVLAQVLIYSIGVHVFWEKFGPQLVDPQQTHNKLNDEELTSMSVRVASSIGQSVATGANPVGGPWQGMIMSVVGHSAAVATEERPPEVSFLRLESATSNAQLQQYYEGKLVRMSGRFSGTDQVFTLLRYKMNCCAADATALRSPIFVDESQTKEKFNPAAYRNQWVMVTARVHFRPGPGGAMMATLVVTPTPSKPLSELIKIIPVDPNPYVY